MDIEEVDISEVIENLEYMISGECTDTQYEFKEEVDIAIEALKKQIPCMPVKVSDPYDGDESMICLECSAVVQDGEWSAKFCPNCGHKIKW